MTEEIKTTGDTHNCERDGHCLHEGTPIGSLWCCKCLDYIQITADRLGFYEAPYPKFVREQRALIDAHPEWGIRYL